MKYKMRQVFTVIREMNEEVSLHAAKNEACLLADEGGEFLYGGAGDDSLTAKVEIFKDGKWVIVEC